MDNGNSDVKEVVTGSEVSEETKVKALSTFLTALDFEEKTLHSTQELLARQKSLNTVYQKSLSYQTSSIDRKKAIAHRNYIAKANIDYTALQTLWTVSIFYIFLHSFWYINYLFYLINMFYFQFIRKIKMALKKLLKKNYQKYLMKIEKILLYI